MEGAELNKEQGAPDRRRTGRILGIAFAIAIVMGPGPGIYLVNPGLEEAPPRLVLGMPIVYAWAAFWFLCQAVVVVLAYRLLWKEGK